MTFREECEEWLEPLGFTLHSYSGDELTYIFTGIDLPAITCELDVENNTKTCRITDSAPYKLFLSLSSGDIMFKHPDIEQYIKVFNHYAMMAERYPPW